MNLVVALLVLLQASSPPSTPPEQIMELEPESLAEIKGADLDLLGEVRRIATRVEQLRSQRFDRPPLAVRVQDAERLRNRAHRRSLTG